MDRKIKGNGARGRIRTADTAIFSRMLYQLSYPGNAPGQASRRAIESDAYKRQSRPLSTP
jgi:hypothetical protein